MSKERGGWGVVELGKMRSPRQQEAYQDVSPLHLLQDGRERRVHIDGDDGTLWNQVIPVSGLPGPALLHSLIYVHKPAAFVAHQEGHLHADLRSSSHTL